MISINTVMWRYNRRSTTMMELHIVDWLLLGKHMCLVWNSLVFVVIKSD